MGWQDELEINGKLNSINNKVPLPSNKLGDYKRYLIILSKKRRFSPKMYFKIPEKLTAIS